MEQVAWIIIGIMVILLWGAIAEINHLKNKYEDNKRRK